MKETWWNGNTKTMTQIAVAVVLSIGSVLGIQTVRGSNDPAIITIKDVLTDVGKVSDDINEIKVILVKIEENTRK